MAAQPVPVVPKLDLTPVTNTLHTLATDLILVAVAGLIVALMVKQWRISAGDGKRTATARAKAAFACVTGLGALLVARHVLGVTNS